MSDIDLEKYVEGVRSGSRLWIGRAITLVESTRAEPGALNYQWCISDDNTTVHNFDRYSDSAAAKTHLDGFLANYAGRYMAAVDTTRLSVYGAPSDEVKEILNGFGGVYYGLIEGFTR